MSADQGREQEPTAADFAERYMPLPSDEGRGQSQVYSAGEPPTPANLAQANPAIAGGRVRAEGRKQPCAIPGHYGHDYRDCLDLAQQVGPCRMGREHARDCSYEDALAHARVELWWRLGRLRLGLANIDAMPPANAEWSEEYRQGYDKAMSRVRAEVARTLEKYEEDDDDQS